MRISFPFAHMLIRLGIPGLLILFLAACGGTGDSTNTTSTNNGTIVQRGAKSTPTHPASTITEFPIPTHASDPREITAGPDGNLWFTESNKIGRITTGK